MDLQRLDEHQITKLYQEHMVIDFPKDELKPLKMILQSVQDGFYDCLGTSISIFIGTKIKGISMPTTKSTKFVQAKPKSRIFVDLIKYPKKWRISSYPQENTGR